MSCNTCKYAVYKDYGYSNYTVEGTDFECAMNAHPSGTFDRFYGKAKELEFGLTCKKWQEGEPIQMDVERCNVCELSDEQKEVWAML